MKRIRFIYGAMLLVLALAMNACDDYYSVAVAGDPGVTPVVLTTPEESITLPAKDAAGEPIWRTPRFLLLCPLMRKAGVAQRFPETR